ncbi:MAG: hypothetical protein RLZZ445_3052 [Pseudomonadota bacterium]|jgi:tripartite-type tricarboxylate transporter receptor subunit TctC
MVNTKNIAAMIFAVVAGSAFAADPVVYPEKPVRMVIHIGPGSSMDIVGRMLAQNLSEDWGRPVIVDNRAGAGGSIGMAMVAKAFPDGYTILFASSSMAIAGSYYKDLPFDVVRDFEPVTQISSRFNVLVVKPDSPMKSIRDVISAAKAKPGSLTFGSGGGNGSSDHMAGALFNLLAGVDITHVPYKSGAQAQTDLMGGRMSIYLGGMPINLPMIKSGKMKALGVSSTKRSALLPDVPTIAEAGVPGYEVNVWYGLFAPRGTPPSIVKKISADVSRIVRTPETRERLAQMGADSEGTTPAAFKAYFRGDFDKWIKVVKATNLTDQ